MTEKELKFRQMEKDAFEKYLLNADFTKPFEYEQFTEEFWKLKRECEAFGKLTDISRVIAQGKCNLQEIQKVMRNPKK